MPFAQVIALAVLQGITEFLPVSSTAHLYLASWLFGWKTQALEFDIALHLGTLLAILIYFLPDWIRMVTRDHVLLAMLALGSIPVGIAGLVFGKQAAGSWRSPYVMGTMLIVVGLVMGIADSVTLAIRPLASLNFRDSLQIGLSQALALIPGTSRSAITITTGLIRDFDRESAARFSFLLSAPVVGGAVFKMLRGIHKKEGLGQVLTPAVLAGVAVSAATGSLFIGIFLHYLEHGTLRPFAYYRVISGIIVLALASIRRPAG